MVLSYWYREAIPPEINWIIGLLGVVAFVLAVLAVPSVMQMIVGRAHLKREYETNADGADRTLLVFLSNPPVKRKFWRRIGVQRVAIQSLEAAFQIREAGSGKVLDTIRHAQFNATDDPSDKTSVSRIVLPPTFSVGATMMLALWDEATAEAVVMPDRLRPALGLTAGLYHIQIVYQVDGEPLTDERTLKVGHRADDLMWIKKTPP